MSDKQSSFSEIEPVVEPLSAESLKTLQRIHESSFPVRDYWRDRRVSRRPFEGEDRRSFNLRRQYQIDEAIKDRRSDKPAYRFRRSHRLLQLFVMLGDLSCLMLALLVPALTLGWFDQRAVADNHYIYGAVMQFSVVAVFFLVFNWLHGFYSKRCAFSDDLGNLFKAVFIAVGIQSTIAGLVGDRSVLLGLLLSWGIVLVSIPLVRLAVKRKMFNAGVWTRPTVIIGAGANAKKTAEAIQSDWLLGFNIVEFISCDEVAAVSKNQEQHVVALHSRKSINVDGHRIPVRHVDQLSGEMFNLLGNPHIVVATDSLDFWDVIRILYEQHIPYSSLNIAPSLGGVPMIGLGMSHVFRHDVLMLTVQNNLSNFIPRLTKRAFDVVSACALALLLSPFLLMIVAIVRLSGKGVFYGHERIGQNGKPFKCYKFRSMVNNSKELLEELLRSSPEARAEWAKDFKLKNDPRITPFGHFIRKTSIDELPQLWNVIKGDMSLVGPRPVVLDELERYEDKQNLYHMVKPGITGLWQVSGRNDISYEDRVNLDSWYSRNWSLWYDVVILCKTIQAVLQRSGAY